MLARFHVPLSWGELSKRTVREAMSDDIFGLAAQQAYYFLFSLFPALLALISIASYFPVGDLLNKVISMLGGFVPPDVIRIITGQLEEISSAPRGGILTIAFLFAVWSSSSAMTSMITTLNAAYDVKEGRPWWKTRLIAIALTVALAVFILVSMTLIIAGPALAEKLADLFRLGPAFAWAWKILQWPIVFALVATGIVLIYYYAPDVEQDWVWITPGSVLATVLWILVSLGLKLYLQFAGDYNETYGAIGGVMVLMLWFYLSSLAILIGAELNAEIEHASPHGKDVGEKYPGQKKKIGAAAARAYAALEARGESLRALAPSVTCAETTAGQSGRTDLTVSEVLIGAAALLPVALKIGRDVTMKIRDHERNERAA
jgi:membrane protein